jgi:N-acetylglucosamine-6-phosphate deacetylase
MAGAVQNMYKLICDAPTNKAKPLIEQKAQILGEVLNMASRTPASVIGLDGRGQLKRGFQADFVLLNDALQVQACWIKGEQVAGSLNAES